MAQSNISFASQSRILQSRVLYLQQRINQMSKKNIQKQHNTKGLQSKQQYLQSMIQNILLRINNIQNNNISKNQNNNDQYKKYNNSSYNRLNDSNIRLNDITLYNVSNNKSMNSIIGNNNNKQNSNNQLSSLNSSNIILLIQQLQSNTINNLQRLQQTITLSNESLQMKCSKMQIKMLSIWRQAQSLIHNLSYQLQTNIYKIKSLQDKINRDKSIINIQFNQLSSNISNQIIINNQNIKSQLKLQLKQYQRLIFNNVQSINSIKQQLSNHQLLLNKQISPNKSSFIKQDLIKLINQQITKLINQQINKLINQNNQQLINQIQSKINNQQHQNQLISKRLNYIQQQIKSINHKIYNNNRNQVNNQWRNRFNSKQSAQQNNISNNPSQIQLKQSLKIYKQSQRFISIQNSSEEPNQDPWINNNSQDFISTHNNKYNHSLKKLQPPSNKLQPPSNKLQPKSNKLIMPNTNPFQNHKLSKHKSILQQQTKIQQQEQGFVRGIAGLRNMKKKQQQKKSLSKNKNILQPQKLLLQQPKKSYQQQLELRNNPCSNHNLRQLPGLQSPSKSGSKKALPPLSSQKGVTAKTQQTQMQRQSQGNQMSRYPNYNQSPQNESDGQESYFIDEQGFLIDKQGNRLINENGQQIQLSYQDLQRLKQMDSDQNE